MLLLLGGMIASYIEDSVAIYIKVYAIASVYFALGSFIHGAFISYKIRRLVKKYCLDHNRAETAIMKLYISASLPTMLSIVAIPVAVWLLHLNDFS